MIEYKVTVNGNGSRSWFLNDKLHREDGPAIERINGCGNWFLNGKLHREDGPAITHADGYEAWYLNGKRHREDGPAVEYAHGDSAWYLNGQQLTEAEFSERMNLMVEMTVAELGKKLNIKNLKIVK